MSASKKKTTTRKSSPAPATKSAAPARKKAPRFTARAVPPPPAAIAPAVVAAPPPAVVKPAAPKPSLTTITAQVDVGFGNTLYIRGAGGGLSWTVGLPMTCVAADLWRISLDAARPPAGPWFVVFASPAMALLACGITTRALLRRSAA